MKREMWITSLVLLISVSLAAGAEYTVGHDVGYDYNTITEALAAAVSGDTILVADGTYNATDPVYPETFPLVMVEGVILKRENSSANPVLDAECTARVFECVEIDPTPITRIEGLYITGG